MNQIVAAERVHLGEGVVLQPGVLLGVVSGRGVASLDLAIGAGSLLRAYTIVYAGTTIGERFQTGHGVVVREQNRIGDDVCVWNNTTIDYGCALGNRVKVHCNCYLAQFTELEDDVFLAPGVVCANDPHPVCGRAMKGPTIRRMARVGINATLAARITIGEYALVGSGAVVTRDVPPGVVVVGNPARVAGKVEDLECKLGIVEQPYPLPCDR